MADFGEWLYFVYVVFNMADFFAKTFGCCRKVYNLMLSDKIQFYKDTKFFGKQPNQTLVDIV